MTETLTLPSDPASEFFVLSACFHSAEMATEVMSQVQESDFHSLEMKTIYGLMRKCFEVNPEIGIYPIMQRVKAEKLGVMVDAKLIFDLSTGYTSSYDHYIERLKMFSAKRKAVGLLQDAIKDFCNEKSEYEECVERLQDKLVSQYAKKEKEILSSRDIDEDFNEGKDFEWYIKDIVDRRRTGENVFKGIPSNYKKLDDTIGGFKNGSLTYIGARSHMGKTTFMLNLIAQMGPTVNVGVMSLEMPAKALYENFISILAHEHHYQVSSGMLSDAQLRNVIIGARYAREYNTYWEEYGEASIGFICSRAKKLFIVKKIEILFIDYLTCIHGGKSYPSKHHEVTDISKRLQGLSKDLNIPIVCLAQLNRESAKDAKRPVLTDFRESGSIEQDADTCLLLHRPAYYEPDHKPGIMEVNVAKNRLMKLRKTIEYGQSDGKERMLELDYFNEAMEQIRKKEKKGKDLFAESTDW